MYAFHSLLRIYYSLVFTSLIVNLNLHNGVEYKMIILRKDMCQRYKSFILIVIPCLLNNGLWATWEENIVQVNDPMFCCQQSLAQMIRTWIVLHLIISFQRHLKREGIERKNIYLMSLGTQALSHAWKRFRSDNSPGRIRRISLRGSLRPCVRKLQEKTPKLPKNVRT